MKHLTLALALLSATMLTSLANVASARSLDHTPVVATVEGHEGNVDSAALLMDGRLQVKLVSGKVKNTQLADAVAKKLVGKALNLSAAELSIFDSPIVCRMMLRPTLSYLSVAAYDNSKQSFVGTPRLLLTPSSCAISHKVSPKEVYDRETALELQAQLAILALQLAK